jgi:hypothetical protein
VNHVGGTDLIDNTGVSVKRVNKTKIRAISGVSVHKIPLDDSIKVHVQFYVKQGGEYRKLPYNLPEKGFCKFQNEDEYIYKNFAASSDFPYPLICPLPAVSSIFRLIVSFNQMPNEFPGKLLDLRLHSKH